MNKNIESIDASLQSIANSLKECVKVLKVITGDLSSQEKKTSDENPLINFSPTYHKHSSLTAKLFWQISHVYLEEERIKRKTNRSKKSARRVSVNLRKTLESFFTNQLHDEDIIVEQNKDGLIVFYKDEHPFATLKYMTDLGFCRGKYFHDEIRRITKLSQKEYNVSPDKIIIVIGSMRNSLDKKHIEDLLDVPVLSNTDFLENYNHVKDYVQKYISSVKSLENPYCQIFFLSPKLHPNVIASELLDYPDSQGQISEEIEKNKWIATIDNVIKRIRELSRLQ